MCVSLHTNTINITSAIKGWTAVLSEGAPPTAPAEGSVRAGLSASVGGAGEEALPSTLVVWNGWAGLSAWVSVRWVGGKWQSCLG